MKRKFFVLFALLTLLFLISCSFEEENTAHYSSGKYSLSDDVSWVVNVEKNPDEDFVVLCLSDIQLGTVNYFLYWDEVSEMIDSLVEESNPDLIILTGDISYGCGPAFLGICSYINSYDIPWAPVFGNHDCEDSGMSPDVQAATLEKFDNCLFKCGPKYLAIDEKYGYEQKGNYVVNIVSKGESDNVIRSFVMINSGTSGVNEFQRQWFIDCASSVENSKVGVVMHIPTDGYSKASNAAFKLNKYKITLEESYTPDVWNEGYETSFGVQHEGISSANSVDFESYAKATENTDFFLCGHDHLNCTCIEYNGITYVFSLKTGPGCYYESGLQGGTKLTIDNNGNITTEHLFY